MINVITQFTLSNQCYLTIKRGTKKTSRTLDLIVRDNSKKILKFFFRMGVPRLTRPPPPFLKGIGGAFSLRFFIWFQILFYTGL